MHGALPAVLGCADAPVVLRRGRARLKPDQEVPDHEECNHTATGLP